jgi:hypothetical protein
LRRVMLVVFCSGPPETRIRRAIKSKYPVPFNEFRQSSNVKVKSVHYKLIKANHKI